MTHSYNLRPVLLASAAVLGLALPAQAEPPTVVTDIAIIGAMVDQVMGDLGASVVLMDQGGDPHSYQMRPSQARALNGADLLVWVGPELSPWLARPAAALPAGNSLPLLALPGTHLRAYAETGEAHDHDHDHEHEHEHEHGEDDHAGHDHSGTDPHAWLDPDNSTVWLNAIAETLSQRDPENAATYHANAEAGVADVEAADAALAATLAPLKDRRFVVFHDAYGYFTDHYGLAPAIAVSLGDASSPSAARLQQVRGDLVEQKAVCAFPEANHDPRLLQTAIEGTGLRLGDAIAPEGRPSGTTPSYPQFLNDLGQTISGCLSE